MSDPSYPSPQKDVIPGTGQRLAPPPAPATEEDASSQALSEALRSSFQVVKVVMAALVIGFFCSGVFVVESNQVAVILRFGKPIGLGSEQLLKPGWHWAWPYPVDEIVRIPIGQSHTVTSSTGWYATTPEMEARKEEPQARGSLMPGADGYTLTADGNIIHVRATIKYRINDPLRYEFGFTNVTEILTNVVNDALIFASARVTADAALYKDRIGYRDLVLDRVKRQIEDLRLGITLDPSDVETKAPADVRADFEAVNAAEQERSKTNSLASGNADEMTRRAVGEAEAIISGGLSSSNRVVQDVVAFAQSFNDQLPAYRGNPGLFRSRLLTATMNTVLTNAQEKFFLPDTAGGQSRELRLQLSREPVKSQTPTPARE